MFEFSIACKYLIPRWRQLSVSLISLVSILVISLVVWLIIVFFSVTQGLETVWTEKLVAITAPVRVTPTEAYYDSYYYQVDGISDQSHYTLKTLGEKRNSPVCDPYDPQYDIELPLDWPAPDCDASGSLRDLVPLTFEAIQKAGEHSHTSGLLARDYEVTVGNLHLKMARNTRRGESNSTRFVSQATYLGSFDHKNPRLSQTLVPLREEDRRNIFAQLQLAGSHQDLHSLSALVDPQTKELSLPSHPTLGDGVIIPKHFMQNGARVGDLGTITYSTPTMTSMQEQKIPVFIAGFYDPGILPIGGKLLLIRPEITAEIAASHGHRGEGNGINVWFDDLGQAEVFKSALLAELEAQNLQKYWNIETYREFSFARDLLNQLQSERNLFTLISIIIIVVACSNIITLLILLVNDKKLEIGILRSMGASSWSIAGIFGFCGFVMGALGSCLGTIVAIFTLRHLQALIDFISHVQGYAAFNESWYGETLPNQVSTETLLFVLIATTLISLLAGIVPAVKACMMKPSAILRSE